MYVLYFPYFAKPKMTVTGRPTTSLNINFGKQKTYEEKLFSNKKKK